VASYTERRMAERGIIGYEPVPTDPGMLTNPELVQGASVVTPPGTVRYSRAYASLRMGRLTWAQTSIRDAHRPPETLAGVPTFGWAVSPFGDADTATLAQAAEDGTSTVLVRDADGDISIRPVSEYARVRRERRVAQASETDAEQARMERLARLDAMRAGLGSQADYD
jgi:hypothetical protein